MFRQEAKQKARESEKGRQLVLSYDLPPERLGLLLEEKELETEVNLIRVRLMEALGQVGYDVHFHQREDDQYGYVLNQLTAYITLHREHSYKDLMDKDLTSSSS